MASVNSKQNGSSRAVLCLRMSDEDQVESIPAQRTELEKYAKAHGYTIVREYVDSAISGDDTERRAGFLAMREAAGRGEFDVILAWDQDRFGRFDLLDAGHWIYPFRQAGVRLETIAQGKIDWEDLTGQFVYSANQLGKAQFLRDLSRNTTRGLLASARDGRGGTGGSTPFGYRSKDGEVSIVEEEAKIVRLVFDLYLRPGGSLRGVASELNRRKVSPPRSKLWRDSSVRSILDRRKYTGTFVFGNRNSGRYHSFRGGEIMPRRKSDKTTKSSPITHEGHFEAIVDQETFDKAQAKLVGSKCKTARKQARQYILSGLLKCGDCGGALGGMRGKYVCRRYHSSGSEACYHNSIHEAPLVRCISQKIQDRYTSEAALARLRKALEKAQDGSRPRPKDLARLRKQTETLDRKISNAEEAVFEAPASVRTGLYRKLEEFTSERDRLKADLSSQTGQEARRSGRDGSEIDRAIDALRSLGEALSKARPEDSRELLASIVTKIELFFDHEKTEGGRTRNEFSHGKIYVRPNAGESRGVDPKSTPLSTTG